MPADDVVAQRFRPDPQAVSGARRFLRRALTAIEGGAAGDLVHMLVIAGNHDRSHPEHRTRQLIRELERLSGQKVTLHNAA